MDYSDSFHHGDVAHINHVLRSDFSRRQGHQREQQFLRVCVGNANKCKFHSIRNRWINHASGNSWPTLALTSYIYMETVLLWPKALRHQHTHISPIVFQGMFYYHSLRHLEMDMDGYGQMTCHLTGQLSLPVILRRAIIFQKVLQRV